MPAQTKQGENFGPTAAKSCSNASLLDTVITTTAHGDFTTIVAVVARGTLNDDDFARVLRAKETLGTPSAFALAVAKHTGQNPRERSVFGI